VGVPARDRRHHRRSRPKSCAESAGSAALHNYTTFANILAFPAHPAHWRRPTFSMLVLASGVMSGYAMYVYARKRPGT
jgi:hypothetical protein